MDGFSRRVGALPTYPSHQGAVPGEGPQLRAQQEEEEEEEDEEVQSRGKRTVPVMTKIICESAARDWRKRGRADGGKEEERTAVQQGRLLIPHAAVSFLQLLSAF